MHNLKILGKEKVGKFEFTGIEGGFGENKKAMLVRDIAMIHGSTTKRINELINRNRRRFKDGIDIIDLLVDENFKVVLNDLNFSTKTISNSNNIYLLSERGYAKLLKILEDDKAWEIYDELVDNYFNMRSKVSNNLEFEHEKLAYKKEWLEEMKKQNANKAHELRNQDVELYLKLGEVAESYHLPRMAASFRTEAINQMLALPVGGRREYSASEIADVMEVSPILIGKWANKLGIKRDETLSYRDVYGTWHYFPEALRVFQENAFRIKEDWHNLEF
ncbi:ORF6N domain-containing protein [Ligilactobacillus agilis]|uniref:ORF6N domain-containing protein n=1 Tax=Ligilactobacillus agilis TaxID=1601 RepID=UPI00195CB8A1|nr:ORF6N domain-containing protein [Ligilactobacillus agilis]MBM6773475.1 ORF6N domain-containing protein [Ligilactobacillus agilis]